MRLPEREQKKKEKEKKMNRLREKTTATLLIAIFMVSAIALVVPALAKKPFLDITLTGETYDIFWEPTYHPKHGEGTVDDIPAWSHTDTELFPKLTGAILHSWDTFEDYPSYTFVDKHVLVYDKELKLYGIKGSTLDYVWMSDGAVLHPDDVDAYVEVHSEAFVTFHMVDHFIGVAKFAPKKDADGNVFHWMLYRQYGYWIQNEWSEETYGFPEEIGERIHAEHDGTTYVSSDKLWQATVTYYVLHEGRVPSDIGVKGKFVWLERIYDAFPETFKGFNYRWVPQ